jgi:hypothetical protein
MTKDHQYRQNQGVHQTVLREDNKRGETYFVFGRASLLVLKSGRKSNLATSIILEVLSTQVIWTTETGYN